METRKQGGGRHGEQPASQLFLLVVAGIFSCRQGKLGRVSIAIPEGGSKEGITRMQINIVSLSSRKALMAKCKLCSDTSSELKFKSMGQT